MKKSQLIILLPVFSVALFGQAIASDQNKRMVATHCSETGSNYTCQNQLTMNVSKDKGLSCGSGADSATVQCSISNLSLSCGNVVRQVVPVRHNKKIYMFYTMYCTYKDPSNANAPIWAGNCLSKDDNNYTCMLSE